MAQKINKDTTEENEPIFQFLNEKVQAKLEKADAHPFVKISVPTKVFHL